MTMNLPTLLRPFAPLVALGLALMAGSADAAPEGARRLQLQIDLQRDAALQSPTDRGRSRLTQQLTLSGVLHTDGTPMPNNPLDPEDGRRQLERAQRSQQRMQAAQAAWGGTPAAVPDVAAMQARAQQLMARCGQDRECLMREASAMSAAQVAGGDRTLQARLGAYGQATAACERLPAAAREGCQADARRRHGGGDDGPPDEVQETPYLFYTGRAGCRLETGVAIEGRSEGRFDDVQGEVPFSETVTAQQRRRDDTLCPLLQAVLDTRSGRLWTHVQVVDGAPGLHTRAEKGRAPQRNEGPVPLRWHEAEAWLATRLLNLVGAGEDRVERPAPGGGRTELRLRWRFDPA